MSLYLVKWKVVLPGKTTSTNLHLVLSLAEARKYVADLRLVTDDISAHIYEVRGREVPA